MAQVLVRDLDPAIVEKLKARAADHGRSLQAELKAILEAQASQVTKAEACTRCLYPTVYRFTPAN